MIEFEEFLIREIQEEHVIYLEEGMTQLLTGRTYHQLEFNKEDQFVLNEKMIESELVREILAGKKIIKSVQNNIATLAFKFSDSDLGLKQKQSSTTQQYSLIETTKRRKRGKLIF